ACARGGDGTLHRRGRAAHVAPRFSLQHHPWLAGLCFQGRDASGGHPRARHDVGVLRSQRRAGQLSLRGLDRSASQMMGWALAAVRVPAPSPPSQPRRPCKVFRRRSMSVAPLSGPFTPTAQTLESSSPSLSSPPLVASRPVRWRWLLVGAAWAAALLAGATGRRELIDHHFLLE